MAAFQREKNTHESDNTQIVDDDLETIGSAFDNKITPHSDGFSSCLLLKDDNFRLEEWLAYHWMPDLQHLIVAVDPKSVFTPKHILDTWKDIGGMEIIMWHDPHYRHP